ncbi:MAG: phenylalanine--tRNA ligase subunit alpha, partial [Phascolarctobacterium sp.]|nr:phenylalanine--tRNA ligase subunit alpha [Candidatus Phascolarctobacterium equi]
MKEELEALKKQALEELTKVDSLDLLKDLKVKYLGKKGPMTEILRGMGKLAAEERPKIGQIVNDIKTELQKVVEEKAKLLEQKALEYRLANEKVDITLPGRHPHEGHLHPVTLTLREMKKIFMRMGFDVMEGPEIENDYYNFEALNLPQDHPARDMQDTFYITNEFLLRTQTSPIQARTMQSLEPNTPI